MYLEWSKAWHVTTFPFLNKENWQDKAKLHTYRLWLSICYGFQLLLNIRKFNLICMKFLVHAFVVSLFWCTVLYAHAVNVPYHMLNSQEIETWIVRMRFFKAHFNCNALFLKKLHNHIYSINNSRSVAIFLMLK